MRIVRPIVQTVEQVPKRVRDLGRLRDVAQILIRHGFGLLVRGVEIPGLPKFEKDSFESTPARAAAALQDLGPTYVKLGQVLSTRPDVLPEEYILAFQALQDDVTAMPMESVHAQLAKELGILWRDRVDSFDPVPLATASIAQVHSARLKTGEDVVFKVQRPGLERIIRADLAILHFLAQTIANEFPEANSIDMQGVVAEFESSILLELDFNNEAQNMRRAAANFGEDERVRVPVVYAELTSKRVLCMERLHGVKIREARDAGHDMALVGDRFLSVAYDMLFVHGFFHGDLHPGNVLIMEGGVIGLIDWGMTGRLTADMRNDVIFIIFALQRGDTRSIAHIVYGIAIKKERVDYRAVERATTAVIEKHWTGNSMREMQLGPFVIDLARKASENGARIPREYTMFFKALMTAEGLAKALLPEVDPITAAAPYIERIIRERLDFNRLQGDALYHGLTLASVARRLPISLSQFLDDLDAQRLRLDIRTVMDPEVEARREGRENRRIAAIGSVGMLLCGTVALFPDHGWYGSIPVYTVAFYVLGGLLGLTAFGMMLMNRS